MPVNLVTVWCEALIASPLQRSEDACPARVREVITETVLAVGLRGCAERVAQEYGEHPEDAVARMRWARALVTRTFPSAVPTRFSPSRPGYPPAAIRSSSVYLTVPIPS